MGTFSDDLAGGLRQAQALQQRGDTAGAGRQLRALLDRYPDSAALHHALAQQAGQLGRHDIALEHLRRVAALAPDSGVIQLAWGCLLAHGGQYQAALAPLRESTRLMPTRADAFHFLGITLDRLQRDAEALQALRRAHALAPAATRSRDALAELEFRAGFPDDALPLWQARVRDNPDDADACMKLAETYSRLGDQAAAIRTCTEALARTPESADLWMALAQMHEDAGDRSAAGEAYDKALSLRPGWAFPLAGALGLLRGKAAPAQVDEALRQMHAAGTPDRDRALIGYELGKVFDARGEHDLAMQHWHEANAARRRMTGEFDAASLHARVERMLPRFTRETFAQGGGSADQRPVFIVGMPRSGTTLTEQIIAAHPAAHGCGELPDIALIANQLPSRQDDGGHWPILFDDIDDATLQRAIARYLRSATRHAPPDALRLVDKAPMNYYALGLVAMMFPRARIIWCRRDPRDVAVSIYSENFSLGERFATRLDAIGHCINLQNRLMRHWQATLPNPLLELHYEELASEPETQARRLLSFIDLPWDPACLDFHASERGVQTPSRWQVRQPVHTRSIGRWRHYATALGPLLEVLDEPPGQG